MGLGKFEGSEGRLALSHHLWLGLVLGDLRAKMVERQVRDMDIQVKRGRLMCVK